MIRLRRPAEPIQVLMVILLTAAQLPAAAGQVPAPDEALGQEGQAVVVLPPVAYVDHGTVTLKDVAHLEGPQELTERLERVPVGAAPLPGRSRWVEIGYLAVRLRQAGIDPRRVRVEGPERMELVTRPAAVQAPGADRPASVPASEPAVVRGETVILEAVAGSVLVQVAARAVRSAGVGERVPVVNVQSGREVEAIVIGPGRVRAEVAL